MAPDGSISTYGYDTLVLHQTGANTPDGASYTYDPTSLLRDRFIRTRRHARQNQFVLKQRLFRK